MHLVLPCHAHPAKPQQADQQQENCAWFRDAVRRIPKIVGGGQLVGIVITITVPFINCRVSSVGVCFCAKNGARPIRATIGIADASHGQNQPITICRDGYCVRQCSCDAHHRIALVQPFQLLVRPGLTHFHGRAYHGQCLRLPKGERRVAIEIAEDQWLGKRPGMGDDGRLGDRRAINAEQVIIGPGYSRHNQGTHQHCTLEQLRCRKYIHALILQLIELSAVSTKE